MSYNVSRYVKHVLARFLKLPNKETEKRCACERKKEWKATINDLFILPFFAEKELTPLLNLGLTIAEVAEIMRGGNVSYLISHLSVEQQNRVKELLSHVRTFPKSYQTLAH